MLKIKRAQSYINKFRMHFLILLFFSFILLLVIFEIILKINNFSYNIPFFKEDIPFINREINQKAKIYQSDPWLFWKYRPNSEKKDWDIRINSLGFRDKEFSVKQKEIFRIIILGDSCTAGHGLQLKDTYSKQLEELLNQKEERYEAINGGVPGYSSFQGLRYFQSIARKYPPDLVIIFLGTNDKEKALYEDKELNPLRIIMLSVRRNFILNSKVLQFVMSKIYNVKNINWKPRVSPQDYRYNLLSIVQEANNNNIEVLFIKPTNKLEIKNNFRNNSYIPPNPYIDLFDTFKYYQNNTNKIFLDQIHFNESGNRIIAEEIYNWLKNHYSFPILPKNPPETLLLLNHQNN